MIDEIQQPNILIFLTSDLDKNVARIRKRGREMEVGQIDMSYLNDLSTKYNEFK